MKCLRKLPCFKIKIDFDTENDITINKILGIDH